MIQLALGRRMMALARLATVVVVVGTTSRTAHACYCVEEFGLRLPYHAVFVGTVVSSADHVPPRRWMRALLWHLFRISYSFGDFRWRVRVRTSWFGVTTPDVIVVTWVDSSCSAEVEVGQSYLFRTMSSPPSPEGTERIGACEFRPTPVDLATFDESTVTDGGAPVHWPR